MARLVADEKPTRSDENIPFDDLREAMDSNSTFVWGGMEFSVRSMSIRDRHNRGVEGVDIEPVCLGVAPELGRYPRRRMEELFAERDLYRKALDELKKKFSALEAKYINAQGRVHMLEADEGHAAKRFLEAQQEINRLRDELRSQRRAFRDLATGAERGLADVDAEQEEEARNHRSAVVSGEELANSPWPDLLRRKCGVPDGEEASFEMTTSPWSDEASAKATPVSRIEGIPEHKGGGPKVYCQGDWDE